MENPEKPAPLSWAQQCMADGASYAEDRTTGERYGTGSLESDYVIRARCEDRALTDEELRDLTKG